MITYNHARYIAQAIEGVLAQKTDFPIELVIGEDCSTDGTRKIVLEYKAKYPEIIRTVISDENVGARVNNDRTVNACQGKYIAFCEGDDYWVDPLKLQKQVDFLGANPDYGMVHTDYNRFSEESRTLQKAHHSAEKIPQGDVYDDLLCINFVATLTVMVEKRLVIEARTNLGLLSKNWPMGDYPMWLEISRHAKVGYIKDVTSTYRVLPESASHSTDPMKSFQFSKSRFEIASYFIDTYGCSEIRKAKMDVEYHKFLLNSGFLFGDYELAKTGGDFLINSKIGLSWKRKCLIYLCVRKQGLPVGKMICLAHDLLQSKLFSGRILLRRMVVNIMGLLPKRT
jgi:glycosyltransferase involved in cell wall biosynthesis